MTRDRRSIPGFTLIELIVVVVIIGVLSGFVIPRVMQRSSSAERREAERVAELLSAMANRESLSSQPVWLTWDEESSRLDVRTPSMDPDDDEAMRPDRLIPGVTLGLLEIREATADLTELGGEAWTFRTTPGLSRPLLTMTLESDAGRMWTVTLEPQSTVARLAAGEEPAETLKSIDLDEEGMRDQSW